jgi:hypothetical protein
VNEFRDLPHVNLVGHGATREECLEDIRRKARQYFSVEDDERLELLYESANQWATTYGDDSFMFELNCLARLRDAQ